MKGRLYDPLLRRFITPDPFVTDPLNPQGMNRYAYVQNNPLMFTDPSGFDPMRGTSAPDFAFSPPMVDLKGNDVSGYGMAGAPPFDPFRAGGLPNGQPNYMVNPSTPPPGGGADIASARAEAATQAGQMQQMGQIATQYANDRVANSSAGNSAFNPANPFAGDRTPGGCSTGQCLAENNQAGAPNTATDAAVQGRSGNAEATPYVPVDSGGREVAEAALMFFGGEMAIGYLGKLYKWGRALWFAKKVMTAEKVINILRPAGKLIGESGARRSIGLLKGGLREAESFFKELTWGAEVVKDPSYPGILMRLRGGGQLGLRPISSSGPPTIDVMIEGLGIREIKFLH